MLWGRRGGWDGRGQMKKRKKKGIKESVNFLERLGGQHYMSNGALSFNCF